MFTHKSVVHNLWSNLRSNIKWLHSAFQRLRNEQFYLISFENVVPFLGTSDPFISFFFFDRGCKIDGFPSRGPINFPPNEFDSTSRMSQIYSCKINRPSFVRASIFHACFEIWPGIEAIFFFFRCFSDRCFNREHCTLVEIIFHPVKTWMKYACIYLILFILSVCIYLFASTNLKRAIRKIGSD